MAMKWRILILAGILAVCAGNHVEHYLRAQRIAQQGEEQDVPAVQADSTAAGHSSISIAESGPKKAGVLYFSTLAAWAFSKEAPSSCPPSVMAVDGQRVKLVGFMYPLQAATSLKVFCLLRSTQTCCYGPMPQWNQYVLVETEQPVKFERFAPVEVAGLFRVDPKPGEGYIYRIEAASVRSASGNDQPLTPQEVARQTGLPLFDFAPLEQVKAATTQRETEIARLLIPLDGKPFVLHGYLVGSTKDSPPKLMVGKYAWDGKNVGTPPNLYNTVLVSLGSEKESPPLWWQEAVFKGTLRVTREPAERSKKGVVSLADATLATAPSGATGHAAEAGLFLPLLYELILLAAGFGILMPTLIRIKLKGKSPNGGRP